VHTFGLAQRWSDKADKTLEEFVLSNKRVYLFLLPQDFTHNRLNAIWGVMLAEVEWRRFWNDLWTSDLTTKGKVFLWPIFSQGLFTGSRALKIPIGDGCCLPCPGTIETIPHIFQRCPKSKAALKKCWPLLYGRPPPQDFEPNYFHLVREHLHATPSSTARLFLLYQTAWNLSLGRNASLFNQEQRPFLLSLTLEETSTLLSVVRNTLPPGIWNTRLQLAKNLSDLWHFLVSSIAD
jgi:hypothetical protein